MAAKAEKKSKNKTVAERDIDSIRVTKAWLSRGVERYKTADSTHWKRVSTIVDAVTPIEPAGRFFANRELPRYQVELLSGDKTIKSVEVLDNLVKSRGHWCIAAREDLPQLLDRVVAHVRAKKRDTAEEFVAVLRGERPQALAL